VPYTNIEKGDDQKENISDFILTYDVEYGNNYKNGMGIEELAMKIASEYVKNNLISDQDLLVSIRSSKMC